MNFVWLETVDDAGVVTASVNPECIFIDWGIVLEAIVNFILIAAIIAITGTVIFIKSNNNILKEITLKDNESGELYSCEVIINACR